ncbi:RNA polymerase sigma factor [Pseudozobellia thermophila]|uniref:RNA polymerase sigma-70 factor, ECF subfamily n=1 Tax=Pseudozobellia thermophila TaxID=192903 RepID=A0A1M6MVL1_9FLAO|nr:RNA polymerase sigma-70 factor [Pseudozobellia thermophila]SHJ87456.1 RNA polymerase sigma-70 factor, ECF subfamily [Pseudozobellia thermophila]
MTENYSDNAQLINALKKGSSKAFDYLVDTYHHKLCMYAYSLIHDQDSAEDIVQNVFVRTWQKRHKLKTTFSIKSFLYRSVYNEFIDQYRKRKPFFPLEKKYIDTVTEIVEDDDKHSLERIINLVKQEIQNLPPKCREVFLLSKEDGLSNVEIAEYKNVSIKAVEGHLHKAFSILRKSFDGKFDSYFFLLFGFAKKEG